MSLKPIWQNVEPGDFGWTRGKGWGPFIIRHGSPSPFAHAFVFHEDLGHDEYRTAEAWSSSGMGWHTRRSSECAAVLRIWRTSEEQQAILAASKALVDAEVSYAWGEIARIVLYKLGITLSSFADDEKVICSNHTAQAAVAGRPELAVSDSGLSLRYPPYQIWPGALYEDLSRLVWHDRYHTH